MYSHQVAMYVQYSIWKDVGIRTGNSVTLAWCATIELHDSQSIVVHMNAMNIITNTQYM